MRQVFRSIALAMTVSGMAVALASCNLAQLFGLQAGAPLQGYSVLASNNSSLSSDATGLIEGNTISIELPYGPVANGTPLTPTVKLASGYSVNPSGSYAIRNGMTLTVISNTGRDSTSYTLHVSEIPSTTPSQGPSSAIASFNFLAAKNSAYLSADADGVIYGTDVYVTLPYVVASEMESGTAKLVASVALQSGYTLTNPSPSVPYAYTSGMTLDVTDTVTNESYNYILYVSATPNQQFSGSSSLIQSYEVTSALNPSVPTNETAVVNGTNIYITLPLEVVQAGTPLTPTVTLQSGYVISSPSGSSYAMTDGMTLVVTQSSTGAFTDYTLHVGTSAASMAFLQLASPYYYDANGAKQLLSSSQYNLSFNSSNNTYTLTLNTDSFTSQLPYLAAYVQNVVASRPIGFGTVTTPYNATVTGASSAQSGAVAPYSITVRSSDGTVTNTYIVDVVRTASAWIGISSASASVEDAYDYTDDASIDSGWYASFRSAADYCTNAQTVYWTGGSCTEGSWPNDTVYNFNSNPGNGISVSTAPVDTGATLATPSTIQLASNLTLSASASYAPIASASEGTISRSGSISNGGSEQVYTGCGQGCQQGGNPQGETYTATPAVTLDVTRTYTSAGYMVPTSFAINIPLAITIVSVTPITDVASYGITAGASDNTITFTMQSGITSRITGTVAEIACKAESGARQTLYLQVQ